jgi:hypothetical protein
MALHAPLLTIDATYDTCRGISTHISSNYSNFLLDSLLSLFGERPNKKAKVPFVKRVVFKSFNQNNLNIYIYI